MLNHFFKKPNIRSLKLCSLLICGLALTSCGFFDKDNTPVPSPLVNFTPSVAPHLLWSVHTGSGPGKEYLKMPPAMTDTALYTGSVNGDITAIDKASGRTLWHTHLAHVSFATGPGVGDGIVVVATTNGDVIALDAATGNQHWHAHVNGEVLSQPAIGAGKVIIKSLDGSVTAFSVSNGQSLWSFDQTEPSLVLHGASAPFIQDRHALIGFANGNLVNLNINDGQVFWQQAIAISQGAFAIERMIDIDADPLVYHHAIYAATYQGNISALDWQSGATLWSHDLSSYTGMCADDQTVYISDANSHLWAFGAKSGHLVWQQNGLYARVISGPAVLGDYIVVGDAQGYLHWLNKQDGHFAGRVQVGQPIYASPLADGSRVYVFTSKGTLLAYTYANFS